jgi:hypothetical protein
MWTRFYLPPCGDSVNENFIKISFINVYLNTLYVIFNDIFTQECINFFIYVYYYHKTYNNILIFVFVLWLNFIIFFATNLFEINRNLILLLRLMDPWEKCGDPWEWEWRKNTFRSAEWNEDE